MYFRNSVFPYFSIPYFSVSVSVLRFSVFLRKQNLRKHHQQNINLRWFLFSFNGGIDPDGNGEQTSGRKLVDQFPQGGLPYPSLSFSRHCVLRWCHMVVLGAKNILGLVYSFCFRIRHPQGAYVLVSLIIVGLGVRGCGGGTSLDSRG